MRFKRALTTFIAAAAVFAGFALVPSSVALASPAPVTASVSAPAAHTDASASVFLPETAVPLIVKADAAKDNELNENYVRNGNLPLNRWFLASSEFHDQFGDFDLNQIHSKLQRMAAQTPSMMAGNSFWYLNGEMTRSAVDFDILNIAGAAMDNAAGTIGNTVTKEPAVAGLIISVILITLVMGALKMRGQGAGATIKRAASVLILFALIFVMSGAAATSKTTNGVFDPGTGSPGWVVKSVTDAVANAASVPADAFSKMLLSQSAVTQGTGSGKSYKFSCDAYNEGLMKRANQSAAGNSEIGAITNIVQSIWMVTGIEAWKTAQFGADNPYGDFMYCRMLDVQSPVATPNSAQTATKLGENMAIGSGTGTLTGSYPNDTPVWNPNKKSTIDESMIAWAACRTTTTTPGGAGDWSLAPGWDTFKKEQITSQDCHDWWSAKGVDADLPQHFTIGSNVSDYTDRTDDPRVLNFLKTMHGNDVTAGTTAAQAYVFSSVVMLIIFGLISLMVMGAKIYMLIFMLTLFFVLTASMFTRSSSMEQIAKTSKHFIGVTVFSFGITLILSVIAIITKVLIDFGTAMWGAGNLFTLVWSGLAPIVALIVLHNIFTKVLKVPSPLTPAGAIGWGAAGGAAGAGIVNGLARRTKGQALRKASKAGERFGSDLVNRATGGRFGKLDKRKGGMDGGKRAGGSQKKEKLLNDKAQANMAAPVTRQEKRDQKQAYREEVKEARREFGAPSKGREAFQRLGKLGAEGSRAVSSRARVVGTSAKNLGNKALQSNAAGAVKNVTGKVATGVVGGAQSFDRYMSSDLEGQKQMREQFAEKRKAGLEAAKAARTQTMDQLKERGAATLAAKKTSTAAALNSGKAAITGAPANIGAGLNKGVSSTLAGTKTALKSGSAALAAAPAKAATIGKSGLEALSAGGKRAIADTTKAYQATAHAVTHPTETMNRASTAAWAGTKASAVTASRVTATAATNTARAAATAGKATAQAAVTSAKAVQSAAPAIANATANAGRVAAKVATSQPAQGAALALLAASSPVGGAIAIGAVATKVAKASKARKAQDADAVAQLRARKAGDAAKAEKAAQPQPKAQPALDPKATAAPKKQ